MESDLLGQSHPMVEVSRRRHGESKINLFLSNLSRLSESVTTMTMKTLLPIRRRSNSIIMIGSLANINLFTKPYSRMSLISNYSTYAGSMMAPINLFTTFQLSNHHVYARINEQNHVPCFHHDPLEWGTCLVPQPSPWPNRGIPLALQAKRTMTSLLNTKQNLASPFETWWSDSMRQDSQ